MTLISLRAVRSIGEKTRRRVCTQKGCELVLCMHKTQIRLIPIKVEIVDQHQGCARRRMSIRPGRKYEETKKSGRFPSQHS
jgi:hypothetical protein